MAQNGVPTSLVEKLLDNLRDLTKGVSEVTIKQNNLQDSIDETTDKIADALTKVADRLNTPPRHEELEKEIKELNVILKNYEKAEEEQTDLLKSVIKTIKIAAGLFGLALLIAAILITVVEKTKYSTLNTKIEQVSPIENKQKIEKLEKDLSEHLDKKVTK